MAVAVGRVWQCSGCGLEIERGAEACWFCRARVPASTSRDASRLVAGVVFGAAAVLVPVALRFVGVSL
jgi:hypothetical protein